MYVKILKVEWPTFAYGVLKKIKFNFYSLFLGPFEHQLEKTS
jgi:hypothetical protein